MTVILYLMPGLSFAIDTSATYPGTVTDQGLGAPYYGDGAWVNPDYMKTADGNVSTNAMRYTNVGMSDAVFLTNFNFSIPTGSTINGIKVEINRKYQVANYVQDYYVKLIKAGSPIGNNKASASLWPSSLNVATYGNSTDLWGSTWTASDINSSNFGVMVQTSLSNAFNATAAIDYVRVTISYTAGATTQSGSLMLLGVGF